MFARSRRRPLLALVVAACVLTSGSLASCSGSGSSTSEPTTTTEPPLPVDFQLVSTSPASVGLGHQFGLVLPSEPTAGRRWVVTAYDPAVLLPLGVRFEEDPRLLAMGIGATTTTTIAPTTTIWTPPTPSTSSTSSSSTTTTAPSRPDRAQIISFAGRAPATTTITLRYDRVGVPDPAPTTVTFTIVVTP